jgi:hypothetical protein
MKYVRGSTLLPLTAKAIRATPRVPYRGLPGAELLIYNKGVSDFFFEFEPEEDIERFLLHAHFACRAAGGLLACREDLHALATALDRGTERLPELALPSDGDELVAPLRFVPHRAAFEAIRTEGRWRGRITCCSCGIAGCFAQYAWVEARLCLFLFTISGATLTDVECLPFRVKVGQEQ